MTNTLSSIYCVCLFFLFFGEQLHAQTIRENTDFQECYKQLEKIDIQDKGHKTLYELDCISEITDCSLEEQYRFLNGLITFCEERNQRFKMLQIFNNFPITSDYSIETEEHLKILYYKAEAYEYTGAPEQAMELYAIVYKKSEKLGLDAILVSLDMKIGSLFKVSFLFSSTLEYYEKALDRAKKMGNINFVKRIEIVILNLKIELFPFKEFLDEPFNEPFNESFDIKVQACEQLANILANTPDYFLNTINEHAISRLQIYCALLSDTPIDKQLCPLNHKNYKAINPIDHHRNLIACGRMECENGHYNKALLLLNESLKIAEQQQKNIDLSLSSYDALREAYKANNDFVNAFKFSEKHITTKSRIQNVTRMNSIIVLDHKLRNAEEIKAKNTAIQTANNLLQRFNSLFVFTVLVVLSSILIYILYLKSKRQSAIIGHQKNDLLILNQFKDEILSIISHDLKKTSLSFRKISSKLNFLIKKEDYATLLVMGKQFEVASVQNSKLLNNLVDWARLQKGGFKVVKQRFNALKAVDNISEMFAFQLEEKNIQLDKQISESIETYIDPQIFKTILINLLDNAIKFSTEGDKISIQVVQNTHNFIELKVINRGIGFLDNQIKSFNTHKVLASTKGTKGEKGSGLGLKIINQLAELHKGSVNIEQKKEETIICVLFDQGDDRETES